MNAVMNLIADLSTCSSFIFHDYVEIDRDPWLLFRDEESNSSDNRWNIEIMGEWGDVNACVRNS